MSKKEKELVEQYQEKKHFYEVGEIYLVRTVTMTIVGRLVEVGEQELLFKNASWIAETGRFNKALIDKEVLSEVEPFPKDKLVIVGRGALIDAVIPEWKSLPDKVK